MSDLQYEVELLEAELKRLDDHDRANLDSRKRVLISKRADVNKSATAISDGQYPPNVTRSRPEVLRELRTSLLEYGG